MSDNKPVDLREKYETVFSKAFDVSVPDGWVPLVDRLVQRMLDALEPEERAGFRIVQVKEKFGSLRVYRAFGDSLGPLVDEAEEESLRTCQDCGSPGKRRNIAGAIATLCDEHAAKLAAEQAHFESDDEEDV